MAKSLPVNPVHAQTLGAGALRFFAPPDASHPQPWHSQDDLLACMGLTRATRRRFQALNKQRDFDGQWANVSTADGPTIIASNGMAEGLMAAVARTGQLPAGFHLGYDAGLRTAIAAMSRQSGTDAARP